MDKIVIFTVFLLLLVCSVDATDAAVDESIQLRFFNPNFNMSAQDLQILIERANLSSLGYRKVTERKTEQILKQRQSQRLLFHIDETSNTGLPMYQETVRFLKKMRCSEVPDNEELLDQLFPGAFGEYVTTKKRSEFQERNISEIKTCLAGIEFHFKKCKFGRRSTRGLRGPKGYCDGCGVCDIAIAKDDN